MSERRQSGLWTRNPETGFYEQVPLPPAQISAAGPYQPQISPVGPYQYYQPPTRASQSQSQSQPKSKPDGNRRSFSDRNGVPNPEAGANGVDRQTSRKGRSDTFDAARHGEHGTRDVVTHLAHRHPQAASDDLARVQHGNSAALSATSNQKPLGVDPEYVLTNAPSTAWSPDSMSPRTTSQSQIPSHRKQSSKGRQLSNASNISEATRRGSVPDRSPLQNLESWSNKEEKRARVEQAEERARQRSVSGQAGDIDLGRNFGSLRSEKARVVSDPVVIARSNSQSTTAAARNASATQAENAAQRFRQASDALKTESPPSSAKLRQAHPTANQAKAYDRRPETGKQQPVAAHSPHGSADLGRTGSRKYRARDAGFASGAAMAAAAPTISSVDRAAERGKAAYERRKLETQPERSPVGTVGTTARSSPGGAPQPQVQHEPKKQQHHGLGGFLHRSHDHRGYQPASQPLEDWRQARAARLTAEDMDLDRAYSGKDRDSNKGAWWEKDARRSSSSSKRAPSDLAAQCDGPYEEMANGFSPRLFLKCGPLLRYTGLRHETVQLRTGSARPSTPREREIWKGTVMIMTDDDQSELHTAPTLRIFAQPMDLHSPPAAHPLHAGHELSPESEDPVAGQVKLSRTGRALYVRPVAEIDGDVDLSREENNHGLYSASRTPVLGPQSSIEPDGRASQHITFQDKSRIKGRDGEKAGRYRETKAVRLYSERGYTFWRFSIEIELTSRQSRVAYRINKGPAVGFWVPARGETMNIMFHSCNGFSYTVDSNKFSGPDPLWRDVLNRYVCPLRC